MTDPLPPDLPDPLTQARALLAAGGAATLTTLSRDGWPLPSLTLVATTAEGWPLLLLSALAEHSRNLAGDDRAGLLLDGTLGLDERMTGPRLSLLGRLVPDAAPDNRERYLARHPSAALYVDFADFRFWRLDVARAHLVAGFGRVRNFKGADLLG